MPHIWKHVSETRRILGCSTYRPVSDILVGSLHLASALLKGSTVSLSNGPFRVMQVLYHF